MSFNKINKHLQISLLTCGLCLGVFASSASAGEVTRIRTGTNGNSVTTQYGRNGNGEAYRVRTGTNGNSVTTQYGRNGNGEAYRVRTGINGNSRTTTWSVND